MKVFFLTQFYFDLHKPILTELEKQGHEVFLVEDVNFPWDYRFVRMGIVKKKIYKFFDRLLDRRKKYWKDKIQREIDFQDKYDIFLCINGASFHPCLLSFLKNNNPNIFSILYLWDSTKYYDYLEYGECFDKKFTFDLFDANQIEGVELLPSFWFPTEPRPIKYELSIVGSDHDDRLSIVGKIFQQAQKKGLKTCLKVVLAKPVEHSSWIRHLRYCKKVYKEECEEYERKSRLEYTTSAPIPIENTLDIYDESICILDTDRPVQSGATERVIWSLARGKKIISTNYYLKEMPFYNENQIQIIDRDNPVLDSDFIRKDFEFEVNDYFVNLRIDNWIRYLINIDD